MEHKIINVSELLLRMMSCTDKLEGCEPCLYKDKGGESPCVDYLIRDAIECIKYLCKENEKPEPKKDTVSKLCITCRYWDLCRGMLHDGVDCYVPSDKQIVSETVIGMVQKFGEDSQIDVAVEEMSELIKELIKYKRSKIHFREKQATSRDHVVEEIGDVMFMMEYLKRIFNINDEIQRIIVSKVIRTKERYLDGKNS